MAYHLMIIPGESDNLRALPELLGDAVQVQLIDDPNSALWEVRSTPPDVVLANLSLSDMSGLDLAEIIPNFGLPTRVVLWSSSADAEAQQQAAEFGVSLFLTGDMHPESIHSSLLHELQAAQAAAEAQSEAEVDEYHEDDTQQSAEETHDSSEAAPEHRRRMHDVPPAPPPIERSRRMHDVAPKPSSNEPRRRMHDVAPAPPPIVRKSKPLGGSLAERAKRTAQEEAAAHAEAPVARPGQTRQGATVVTAESSKPIRTRMAELEREVGSLCIMLADRAGMVLAEVGATSGLPTMILLPLLSTSFSTAGQIAQMLGEKGETSALYMHEGDRYDVYCFKLVQGFMLVIVFQKGSSAVKIGTVWVYAKRAIRDIEELLG